MTDLASLIEEVATRFRKADLFYGHGTDNPWDEAVALVLGVTGFPDDTRTLTQAVSEVKRHEVEGLTARRIDERMPLAYLLGKAKFSGHEFYVDSGVVIPRSPIGQLILSGFQPWITAEPATVVDVCCGSGCIGIACALEFPNTTVVLIDDDPIAVAMAQRNVALHDLDDRVTVLKSDLFTSVETRQFELIVANPPYVSAVDVKSLPPEYRHEPERGLLAGDDGLNIVERLMAALPERLSHSGTFVCEVGDSAAALLRKYPHLPFVWPDLPEGGAGVFLLQEGKQEGSQR